MNINCKGRLIELTSPKIMGILNLTPDSFYDGNKYTSDHQILSQIQKMLEAGATFIDVGAYSSRPGSKHISQDEELTRLTPKLELILREFPEILVSIDSFRSKVVEECISIGACMVNDISGGKLDEQMFETISKLNVPYVLMHLQGTPQNMQKMTNYDHLINDIMSYFSKRVQSLRKLKVKDIIIDLGFGFGKDLNQNYELLSKLKLFSIFGLPILTGISRKSMLSNFLGNDVSDSLNATTISNTIALIQGVNILRVHDVKEAMEAIKIVEKLKEFQ